MNLTDELWRSLSTDKIGFYTSLTASKIPERPGIYGWFLPLRLNEDPDDLIGRAKLFFAYDTKTRGVGECSTNALGFNWDPLSISIRRNTDVPASPSRTAQWSGLTAPRDEHAITAVSLAVLLGTIFAPPLYIGLTKSLHRRYEEHTQGVGQGNVFNKRFADYVDQGISSGWLKNKIYIEQLLFVCIPLQILGSEERGLVTDEQQIALVENILKNICGPVFGDR